MTAQVISKSGTDSSYDLIVQVIRPCPEQVVCFELMGMEDHPRLKAFRDQATSFGRALLGDQRERGFRCIIAQRVPEPFVWRARMRAALDKARNPALCYPIDDGSQDARP